MNPSRSGDGLDFAEGVVYVVLFRAAVQYSGASHKSYGSQPRQYLTFCSGWDVYEFGCGDIYSLYTSVSMPLGTDPIRAYINLAISHAISLQAPDSRNNNRQ